MKSSINPIHAAAVERNLACARPPSLQPPLPFSRSDKGWQGTVKPRRRNRYLKLRYTALHRRLHRAVSRTRSENCTRRAYQFHTKSIRLQADIYNKLKIDEKTSPSIDFALPIWFLL
ncbi:hypothetical protein [Lysobacter capsici]|uniref:hypothetical protein n=1 Tax=Lysobacter capsici TaxID=435897 RepID=UPI00398C8490